MIVHQTPRADCFQGLRKFCESFAQAAKAVGGEGGGDDGAAGEFKINRTGERGRKYNGVEMGGLWGGLFGG
jgi:hypothetical protein